MTEQFNCDHLQGTACVSALVALALVHLVAAVTICTSNQKIFNRSQSREWSRNLGVVESLRTRRFHEERTPVWLDISDMVIADGVRAWDS